MTDAVADTTMPSAAANWQPSRELPDGRFAPGGDSGNALVAAGARKG